jgi:hypothetical protein
LPRTFFLYHAIYAIPPTNTVKATLAFIDGVLPQGDEDDGWNLCIITIGSRWRTGPGGTEHSQLLQSPNIDGQTMSEERPLYLVHRIILLVDCHRLKVIHASYILDRYVELPFKFPERYKVNTNRARMTLQAKPEAINCRPAQDTRN